MLIFNDVPSRDLDRPRCNSDFEAYLQRASCALIVVDAGDERWPRDAKRWVERLADSARVPVALLVDLVNFPPAAGATSVPDARRTVETQAAALGAASELPFVGWYVASDDITVDETADCVTAVVDHLDGPADNLGRGSPAKVAGDFLSPARLSQKGPRPSPGTFAESVRASISPSSPF
ncbi:hypothetical protein JL722_49 [Aureococcus anophagefferens]|nr:hypothetical protein JL722_49 [Aureococcus anophagefferens]